MQGQTFPESHRDAERKSKSSGSSLTRSMTVPIESVEGHVRVKKRIIVCCDGTWVDGITTKNPLSYTNVLRLARTIEHEDTLAVPAIPQVVFYQSGIGSAGNYYSEYVEGTTGDSLGNKVEEAYGFIAHNYHPGDDIYLFGFSRGAYTARMVAMFIGAIGVLDRTEMDAFAGIFITYQTLGKSDNEAEKQKLNAQLSRWNSPDSPGLRRAYEGGRDFSVKCLGVFDTVGTLGLPEEITMRSPKLKRIYGFPDRKLGEHIERAYQALALNEDRADFTCATFEQTEEGRRKGQVLEQVWFAGCHSDIGGGYKNHDLADITLTWMVAHVEDILKMDIKYLQSIPRPISPWGAQQPHDPTTGIFALSITRQRPLPERTDIITHETIHPSVEHQRKLSPKLDQELKSRPELLYCDLLPLEQQIKQEWPSFPPGEMNGHDSAEVESNPQTPRASKRFSLSGFVKSTLRKV